jgi:hypothetical protein
LLIGRVTHLREFGTAAGALAATLKESRTFMARQTVLNSDAIVFDVKMYGPKPTNYHNPFAEFLG